MDKKWTAIISIVVVAIIVVSGFAYFAYGQNKKPTPTVNIVTYASSSPMVTLDPSTEFSNSILVLQNTYQSMTYYNNTNNVVEPLLATNWTSNSNATHWTFNLKQGVTFYDGTTFNASSVVFSIDRTMRLGEGAAYIYSPVVSVYAVSQYTVGFNLSYSANMPLILSSSYGAYIMSQNIRSVYNLPSNESLTTWFNQGHTDGTGPYYVSSWAPQTEVILKKVDSYYGGWNTTQYSEAIIQIVSNAATREQMATTPGNAVITQYIPYSDIPGLQNDTTVKVSIAPSYQNLIAFYNNLTFPTNNTLIRQALSYAWPYQSIIQDALNGYGTQSRGPIPVGMWGHDNNLTQYTYNLTKAAQLLAQAGYPNGTGIPTLTLTYTAGDPYEQASAQLYQYALSQIGITLKVEPLVWTQQWSLATSNASSAQNIFVMYWWPTYPTPYDWLVNLFHSGWPPVFNLAYWNNTTFDHLIDQANALEGVNITQSIALYDQAQQLLINATPASFLFDMKDIYVYSSSIHGFYSNPAYETVTWFYDLYT